MQAIIQTWLDKQCSQIHGATGAVVLLLPRDGDTPVPVAEWPREACTGQELLTAARSAYDKRQALTHPRINGAAGPVPFGPMMSCPVRVQGRTVGAVAVGVQGHPGMTKGRERSRLEIRRWTAAVMLIRAIYRD